MGIQASMPMGNMKKKDISPQEINLKILKKIEFHPGLGFNVQILEK